MKVMLTMALAAVVAIACNAQPKVGEMKPMNKKDSTSYAVGVQIATSFKNQEMDMNIEMVAAGMRDHLGGSSLFNEEQVKACLQSMQEESMAKATEVRTEKGAEAIEKSEKFLAENKSKPGVMTTPSGLQYKVVKEGTGKKPGKDNTVKVHYKGTLTSGDTFDSSYDRGQPAEFGVGQVIPGWIEGLQLMSVGSKYMFFIPPALAYGEQGAGGQIGPNEALIFEVELLDIIK
ncbi:MAG: FKBP-type peptidyl-prolyl cis-trans isomerase [Ignavibacteria bacterium]|nr:FKBP-type peptidyl-prolyl cis-trans isomerase [Ignavibacteria bacterium]